MSVTIDREMKIKKPSKFLRLRRFLFWIIFKSNRLHWRGRLQLNFMHYSAGVEYVSIACIGEVGCNLFLSLQGDIIMSFNRLHWRGRLQLVE